MVQRSAGQHLTRKEKDGVWWMEVIYDAFGNEQSVGRTIDLFPYRKLAIAIISCHWHSETDYLWIRCTYAFINFAAVRVSLITLRNFSVSYSRRFSYLTTKRHKFAYGQIKIYFFGKVFRHTFIPMIIFKTLLRILEVSGSNLGRRPDILAIFLIFFSPLWRMLW